MEKVMDFEVLADALQAFPFAYFNENTDEWHVFNSADEVKADLATLSYADITSFMDEGWEADPETRKMAADRRMLLSQHSFCDGDPCGDHTFLGFPTEKEWVTAILNHHVCKVAQDNRDCEDVLQECFKHMSTGEIEKLRSFCNKIIHRDSDGYTERCSDTGYYACQKELERREKAEEI